MPTNESWIGEHTTDTPADAAAVWDLWEDVAGWPAWNADIERITISGPFVAGSTIQMLPSGQEEVRLVLAEVEPGRAFVDEARLGPVTVRTIHRVDELDAHTRRITYRMKVSGPDADEIGPAISGDFPSVLAALAERAERPE